MLLRTKGAIGEMGVSERGPQAMKGWEALYSNVASEISRFELYSKT